MTPGTSTVESAHLRDALNRIKQLEEELWATRLAAKILDDTTIGPKAVPGCLDPDRARNQHPHRLPCAPSVRARLPPPPQPITQPAPTAPRHARRNDQAPSTWPRALLRRAPIHAELTIGMGIEVGSGQVQSIMKHIGIQGISGARRRYISEQNIATHEDLVNRNFTATRENQLWCTDITEHPTRKGKVYCCAVIDAYSRRIVG